MSLPVLTSLINDGIYTVEQMKAFVQQCRKAALNEVIDLVKVLKDNSTDYILDRLMDIIHETNEDQRELMSQMQAQQQEINELKAKQVRMLEANAREIESIECDYTDQVLRAVKAEEKLAQQVAVTVPLSDFEMPPAFGEIQYQRPSGQWGRV